MHAVTNKLWSKYRSYLRLSYWNVQLFLQNLFNETIAGYDVLCQNTLTAIRSESKSYISHSL